MSIKKLTNTIRNYSENELDHGTIITLGMIDEEATALERENAYLKEKLEECHDWYCGCGHWNGANLNNCAMCNRTPCESIPLGQEAANAK